MPLFVRSMIAVEVVVVGCVFNGRGGPLLLVTEREFAYDFSKTCSEPRDVGGDLSGQEQVEGEIVPYEQTAGELFLPHAPEPLRKSAHHRGRICANARYGTIDSRDTDAAHIMLGTFFQKYMYEYGITVLL